MVSFTNHYNAISIDRRPSKTKIGKYSWYFNNSFLCKPEVSSATESFLFLLKNTHTHTHTKTSTAEVDPRHLKVKVTGKHLSNLSWYKQNLSISNVII